MNKNIVKIGNLVVGRASIRYMQEVHGGVLIGVEMGNEIKSMTVTGIKIDDAHKIWAGE